MEPSVEPLKPLEPRTPLIAALSVRELPHAPGERGGIGIFEAGGIDDGDFEIEEPCQPFAAITRDARRVVDQRQLATDEAVEERRFADIWATDDGNPGH